MLNLTLPPLSHEACASGFCRGGGATWSYVHRSQRQQQRGRRQRRCEQGRSGAWVFLAADGYVLHVAVPRFVFVALDVAARIFEGQRENPPRIFMSVHASAAFSAALYVHSRIPSH